MLGEHVCHVWPIWSVNPALCGLGLNGYQLRDLWHTASRAEAACYHGDARKAEDRAGRGPGIYAILGS